MKQKRQSMLIWELLRFAMGFIMLWAFVDKLLGLGFATKSENAWLLGKSPTIGFLTHATQGPFKEFYQSLAGNPVVDVLFMVGLLSIGVALVLGIATKMAGYSGAAMMILMYIALIPPANNPLIDEHIIYMLVFLGFATTDVGRKFGIKTWWEKTSLAKQFPLLK